jgi:hypothetical protein
LRDALNIVVLSNFTSFVSLTSSKNNAFVGVVASHAFKNRFESHARRASGTPKVNDNSRCIFDDFLDDS